VTYRMNVWRCEMIQRIRASWSICVTVCEYQGQSAIHLVEKRVCPSHGQFLELSHVNSKIF
jgi:hypothetical protein